LGMCLLLRRRWLCLLCRGRLLWLRRRLVGRLGWLRRRVRSLVFGGVGVMW